MLIDGYVRVSTLEQAREGYSIGAQTERLKAYCAARGWTLRSIHTDPGHSGAKLDRPGLQTMISDVRAGRCNGVLVYKLDRLSRSQKDTLYLIEDIFLANGVSFISINENFDTSTAFGRAMIGILSVFAQLEREQIRERTMMGAAERAKSGLWHGGGWEPIGYDYIPERDELQVNEYEAMQVREVYDCYLNRRMSLYKITQHMTEQGYHHKNGGWDHASTVRNVLKNNLYAGIISWGGHDYPGQHMPLIDREAFDKVQNKLELQGTQSRKQPEPGASFFTATALLSGILFCGRCGGRYYGSGQYRGSKKLPNSQRQYIRVYACYSRTKTKKSMIKDPACKNDYWRVEILDAYVMEQIRRLAADDDFFRSIIKPPPVLPDEDKRQALRQRIVSLDQQLARLLDLYQLESDPLEQISQRIETLTAEKRELQDSLEAIKPPPPRTDPLQLRRIAQNASQVLESGDLGEKRALIQSLIRRITLTGPKIEITWNL